MKIARIILLLLISFNLCAQDLNGEYISNETSFKDNLDSINNFFEETKFDLFIFIEESNDDGRILIHDERIPDKVLIYKVISLIDAVKSNGNNSFIYKCEAEHIGNVETTVIFFYDKKDKLHLMIHNNENSQVFHDLIKIK